MDNSDEDCQILESGLLVEKNKRIKFYFEGFPVGELVELLETVKKYGGETSKSAGTGIVTLSDPKFHAKTERTRYHVKWLNDTIERNKIQDIQKYKLNRKVNPIFKVEIREDENEEVLDWTSAEFETQADESVVPNPFSGYKQKRSRERATSKHPLAKVQKRSEPQPGSSGIVKPQKKYPYTDTEKKAMIQYLVNEDAIAKAGGRKIWQKMLDDNLMQNHTAASMATHFSSSLKYKISDYTKDRNIIKRFQEQRDERGRKRRRRR